MASFTSSWGIIGLALRCSDLGGHLTLMKASLAIISVRFLVGYAVAKGAVTY